MQDTWGISWPSISSIEEAINQYARLGIEIHISEMSISADSLSDYDLQVQSKRYEDIFKMLRKLDTDGGGKANITSVTIFGLMDGFVFYSNDKTTYTLFDTNFQPKPCFYKIQEVMRLYY